jgi:hypothetical protein
MPLTRDFKETVEARAEKDSAFREALLTEVLDCFLAGDTGTGRAVLCDYINATIGFEALGTLTGKDAKSLLRMLGPKGNPQTRNLLPHGSLILKPVSNIAYNYLILRTPVQPDCNSTAQG